LNELPIGCAIIFSFRFAKLTTTLLRRKYLSTVLAQKHDLRQSQRMNTLGTYLKTQGRGAQARLARDIGLSESQVTRLANGATPLVTTALDIARATNNAVPVESWASLTESKA
jgi:transcriptional regulator with XRE-family HTH domain